MFHCAGLEGSCQDPGYGKTAKFLDGIRDLTATREALLAVFTLETGYPLDNSHQTDNKS